MFGNISRILGMRSRTTPVSGSAGGIFSQTLPLRSLWWAAILLLGLSVGAVGWTVWQLRTDAIRAAIAETGNIASVLAGQLSRSLQAIDTVLLEIKLSTKDLDIDTPSHFQEVFEQRDFQKELSKYLDRLPQVFSIAIADRNGRVAASTVGWPSLHLSVANRDYFQDARNRHDGQISTSIPTNNRINGKQTIVFARRLEDAKGNFLGIVFASVDTRYFEDIYGALQSVHSLLFTLLNPDGIILFRHPDDQNSAGKALTNKSTWLDALSKGDEGFRILGQADGNFRFVSIRPVPEYPLIVDISLTEGTSLTTWRRRAAAIGFGSSVLLFLSIFLLWAISRQVRSLSNSEASLVRKSYELEQMARNDALTGLANRTLLTERTGVALAQMERSGGGCALLMLDLDHFKTVNDTLGHPAGDAVLKEVARRLKDTAREADCVARIGGDEFVVLQAPHKDQKDSAIALARRILAALVEPCDIGGQKFIIGTSIGISLRRGMAAMPKRCSNTPTSPSMRLKPPVETDTASLKRPWKPKGSNARNVKTNCAMR